jgi:NAD(P)-dependent dehydrogenase (short-subunit alcohol dehydrogenase family)
MKIVIVGGTGTIGKAVARELGKRHTIIVAGHSQGDFQVDIKDAQSIEKMFKAIGTFDALISTTGKVHFADFTSMKHDDYMVGLQDKLMGQVNLVLIGLNYIADHGSFTLTSGILSCEPIRYGSSASMVNGAINSFVTAAAIEMPRGIRVNAVSPTILAESMDAYGEYFHGYQPVSANIVALAYSKSVEGLQTGKVYRVGY